ncbi:hypothetical protein [Kurthia sp. Dielmo]|uniref:hypothetical protein n=1 Tax=Kurthia sp. Dielmo TaxID=1033738 RepID=UPI00111DECE0|nr:hypothetical protein [Kurthia sp. Dielmo]
MNLRVNIGSEAVPHWVHLDAYNTQHLNGLRADEIIDTARISSKYEMEDVIEDVRKQAIESINRLDENAALDEDATVDDIVSYFINIKKA